MRLTNWNRASRAAMIAAVALGTVLSGCGNPDGQTSSGSPGSSGPVRGFDGKTITVAGMGVKSQMPSAEWGAKARIERFNKDNELDGITIDYRAFVDDQANPATSLAEARRLVTSENIFAIVGNVSMTSPGRYYAQQEVPYFGFGIDPTYCSDKPEQLWGFGFSGCLTPADPKELPDAFGLLYRYAVDKTGSTKPTIAMFSSDTESGRITAKYGEAELRGTGFDVVFSKAMVPPPPVSDFTPYVQQLLNSNNGQAPDVIQCYLSADCVQIYALLKANGFKGIYAHSLWSDAVLKPMEGSVVPVAWANPNESTPAADQMRADLKTVKPDQLIDIGAVAGYFGASMFIDALKIAANGGARNITPRAVRDAASTMTFEIKDLVGPTRYPDASSVATGCRALLQATGTEWKTVQPFQCLEQRFPVS
ncbi:ABC transporter substrate-binding protein [Acrocarpospora catenulata]|uniref:ABC transporter substrate-binding protein n=1 Tax=Acrocarpospora catenulata TaxID=2836182 RepID=UPI001BDA3C9B|nr:ABC transporter substrate-binding protein [Acrocarpospora catenulata]